MRKKQSILNIVIIFVIFISILFAALNVSFSYAQAVNNPNERDLLIQNQTSDIGCEKIGGFDDCLGVFEDVFVEDSIAYIVSIQDGLLIYDVSNVNNPILLSTWSYNNDSLGYYLIFIAGDYAYLVFDEGFAIIDISSPSSPVFIGDYSSSDGLNDIFIDGDYAYVCVSGTGLQLIDISDKTNPSFVSECYILNPFSVYVEGNTACVAGPDVGLVTVNVTNKASPVELDSMYYSSRSVRVCINNDYAYVASGPDGVYVHNIANPASITLAGHVSSAGNAYDVQVCDDLIYVSCGYHIFVLDVTSIEGSFDNDDYGITPSYGFSSVEDDFAYFILESEGYQILNISDPTDIEVVNEIYSVGHHNGIYVEGNYAYVGLGGYGFGIYDISTPQNPTKVSDLRYVLSSKAYPIHLIVQDSYAYLADLSNGLVVIDIQDINNPINVSVYDAYHIRDVAIQNDYAFIVGDFDRMQILDISDPTNLIEVSNLTIENEECISVAVDGDYAYISNKDFGGFMIVDISSILNPTLVSNATLVGGTPRELAVSGNYVFTANSYSLFIFDTVDKANPIQLSEANSDTDCIQTNGTVTCTYGFDRRIRVYDTTDKANPTLITEYYDESEFRNIFLYNNRIYAANLLDGFAIIGFVEQTPTETTGFSFNFLSVFILATIILGYGFVKRKK